MSRRLLRALRQKPCIAGLIEKSGTVPQGTGFRFARDGGGKSGGYRVIHYFSADDGTPVFLITVFAKNEKANLPKAETEAVKTLGEALSATYRSKR